LNNIAYRAEVDGLRALAVVPVILFHAGFEWFTGGFVGVDVFFVISGYLITTIIISELAEGKFSIVNFYERRARRILPALFFMMAACLPFAWLWLTPSDLKDFGQSLIAVSTFSSNLLFWSESGYFDTAAEFKPLLHTWSLAVEEQYYILFPMFLMLTWRLGVRWVFTLLILGFVTSLGAAQWGAFNKPSATFFLLPTRVWELLVGVFIALYLKYNDYLKSSTLNQIFSMVGFSMIIYSMIEFDKYTPFPSLYALVPTVGTGLLILTAVPKTLVHSLLTQKPLVGVGLVSYSAYLWHQPLFAFVRHRLMGEVSDLLLISLCVASIVMAWFSWRFVEKPFRSKGKISRQNVFIFSSFFISIFAGIGLTVDQNNGFYDRFPPEVATYDQMERSGYLDRNYNCHLGEDESKLTTCLFGRKNIAPQFALVGDSHAGSLHKALSEEFDRLGISFILYAKNGCPPSIGLEGSDDTNCPQFNNNVTEDIKSRGIEVAILFSRFNDYLVQEGFVNSYGVQESKSYYHYIEGSRSQIPDQVGEKVESMKAFVDNLIDAGVNVVYVEPIPEMGWHVPKQKISALANQQPMRGISRDGYRATTLDKFSSLRMHLNYRKATIVPTEDIFCDSLLCYGENNHELLYYDDDHPSKYASKLIVERIVSSMPVL
jgi:peptidoglycan/LPS O-acetylase OafA/YrhL